ncbi:MAG TPA: hypothetical protein VI029_07850, partial [Mycobacterium sp.]
MTTQRSYRHAEAGQQLYAIVETCRKPELLWAKLATGNYDWIGVRRSGRFVLGRPRLAAVADHHDASAELDAAVPHRIEIRGPLDRAAHREPYPTAEEAREAYQRIIAGDPVTPFRSSGVWKIHLVLD